MQIDKVSVSDWNRSRRSYCIGFPRRGRLRLPRRTRRESIGKAGMEQVRKFASRFLAVGFRVRCCIALRFRVRLRFNERRENLLQRKPAPLVIKKGIPGRTCFARRYSASVGKSSPGPFEPKRTFRNDAEGSTRMAETRRKN